MSEPSAFALSRWCNVAAKVILKRITEDDRLVIELMPAGRVGGAPLTRFVPEHRPDLGHIVKALADNPSADVIEVNRQTMKRSPCRVVVSWDDFITAKATEQAKPAPAVAAQPSVVPTDEPAPSAPPAAEPERSEQTNPAPLEIALAYIRRGWAPIPVPFKTKKPILDGWPKCRFDERSAPNYFNGGQQNIGVILGKASGGLTDIDLDCREAIAIAPYLLPPTPALFGRASRRGSHRLYITNLANTESKATLKFEDQTRGAKKATLVEIRCGGADEGAQTIFPGSTHESGEAITWEEEGAPAGVDGAKLKKRVALLAASCLFSRYWPDRDSGRRHNAAITVTGFLHRAGFDQATVKTAIEAIARAAGDEEWKDRVRTAEIPEDVHPHGFFKLAECFGAPIAQKIAEWLNYDSRKAAGEAQPGDDEEGSTESPKPGVILICAADVEAEPIEWLWPDRFALGKIGMIAGEGAGGKSQITIDMAARITTGREWPNDEGIAPTGNVIFLSAEDDLKDTLVPRLMAAGADLERVFFVDAVKDTPARGSQRRLFNVTKDVGRLCEAIDRMGNVRLVVIDPITAYLGSGKEVDSHKAADVRDALNPLKDYAEKLNFTAIIINHLNKGVSTSATSRVLGSGAFVHVARMVYLVAPDTEKARSLFLPMKTNIGKRGTAGLAYRPETKFISTDKHANIETSCIEWDADEIKKSADEALAAAAGRDGDKESDRSALGEAMNFLRDLLSEGPMAATEIKARAKEAGIAWRTIRRAKDRLEVGAEHRGDGGTGGRGEWVWTMPKQITFGQPESGD
jgi:hypothetical protein